MRSVKKTTLAFAIISTGFAFKTLIYFFGTDLRAPLNQSKELFENRCSQCHGIKEANQMNSYLPSSIQETVERMQRKPESGISSQDAEQIYEYLVYEFSRKYSSKLREQLQALPEEKRKQEQAKIDEISSKFGF